ncbi:ABC transporter permease [Halobacteria archaeon AArc-m2/3/4]|uniref:ABC transporter permease n=1 Tax=Natronoglomus mannanivorans TaxID=2979990 RepID=A0AAP2Z2B3_9EURY|nr:ABC transporter permease [Halobacteria archaeon AArc-xg1-1]MCU4972264.1 ABC transporter permease [Halobacteria archaeon AArc-m2/3/4]
MATTEGQLDGKDGGGEPQIGWRHTFQQVKGDPTARFGLYVIAIATSIAVFSAVDANLSRATMGVYPDYTIGEWLPVLENPERMPPPTEMEPYQPPVFAEGGSWANPLGTDQAGRDYLSRIIYGARVSMAVGFFATFLGLTGGVLIGAVAGYYGGRIDDVLMRFVEIIYSIPALVLVIVFTVFVSGGNPDVIYAVLGVGIATIPVFSRIIRSRVLSVREMDYIEAARAAGVKDRNIIRRHVIPNSFAPVLVYATLQIGFAILIVAGLSFLGYGAQPPTPDWGQMLNHAHGQMHVNPWMSIWPGVAILITIMGFNLFGDGLQDALDPRIDN